MVSIINAGMLHYRGLSTDTKPEPVSNGSDFLEMDTGDIYYYDEENESWITPT